MPDDYSQFFDLAYAEGWTDGLPVVPPTEDRVEKMLSGTRRRADEVVGVIGPLGAPATVEKIAVNAVMSGCIPQYLPVVIAAVDALCDKAYQVVGPQVTTNAVAPAIVVNGPIRDMLRINYAGGCLGPGWRSNATIGRSISLVLRNIGGARPPSTSRSTHAQPARYTLCFAEDEAGSPWSPLHVDRGHSLESSAVTVIPVSGMVDCISGNLDADEVFRLIGSALGAWGNAGMIYSGGVHVANTVVITSGRARLFAAEGFSKADVKRGLWEAAAAPAADMPYRHRNRTPLPTVIDGKVYPSKDPSDLIVIVAGAVEPYHAMALPGFTESRAVTRLVEDVVQPGESNPHIGPAGGANY